MRRHVTEEQALAIGRRAALRAIAERRLGRPIADSELDRIGRVVDFIAATSNPHLMSRQRLGEALATAIEARSPRPVREAADEAPALPERPLHELSYTDLHELSRQRWLDLARDAGWTPGPGEA